MMVTAKKAMTFSVSKMISSGFSPSALVEISTIAVKKANDMTSSMIEAPIITGVTRFCVNSMSCSTLAFTAIAVIDIPMEMNSAWFMARSNREQTQNVIAKGTKKPKMPTHVEALRCFLRSMGFVSRPA